LTQGGAGGAELFFLIQEDAGSLGAADEEEAEIDGGEPVFIAKLALVPPTENVCFVLKGKRIYVQHILGPNDEAPACPDGARGHESGVCI
jgi:hypothetical protein